MLPFLFLNTDIFFNIPVAIAHIFNPIEELVIPIGTPSKKAKSVIEIHSVIAGAKARNCSI